MASVLTGMELAASPRLVHRPQPCPPQGRQAAHARSIKAASAASARHEPYDVQAASSAELQQILETLDAQLATAGQQLNQAQASDSNEQAAFEAVQAELVEMQADLDPRAAEVKTGEASWVKLQRLAQQAVTTKALIKERESEITDLQRQLAEFAEAEVPLPVLAFAGGVEADEEGRERLAAVRRQLTAQLQGRALELQDVRPVPNPLARPARGRRTLEALLRSGAFPGLVLLTAASGAVDLCGGVVRLFRRG